MNLVKLSVNRLLLILFTSFILVNCASNEKEIKEVVRINDAVLTEEEIEQHLESKEYSNKYREQFINDWIEREILFHKALDAGILNDKEFTYIIERSKKELAGAFLKKKVLKDNQIVPTINELRSYYDEYKEDFRLASDSYRLNIIHFKDFEKAVQFRNILLESDWDRAVNAFRSEQELINSSKDIIIDDFNLYPAHLQIITSNLHAGEVSLVVETEPSKFTIVQLVDKLNKNIIPPFDMITTLVKERYIIFKQNEFFREYINKLKDDYNIEIIRYYE